MIKVRAGTTAGLGGCRVCCCSAGCCCGCGGLDGKEVVPTGETDVGFVAAALGDIGTSEVTGGGLKDMAAVAFVS